MDTIMSAVQLLENGQSDVAINTLKQYTPVASDEEKFTIADIYLQWGFLQEASQLLKQLLKRYPDESDIKIMLADIYIELEDDKAAINLLGQINKDDPTYIQALLQLADLYQAEGLFEVTERKLLEAKELSPDEPVIDFALGEFLFSIGEYKRSTIFYETLLRYSTEFAGVSLHARLAEAYAASGEYEKALQYFQKLETQNPDTLFKYGVTAFYADRKDIAINVWKKVIDIDPYYHTVYYELAKAYQDEELIEEAYETCKKGLEMDEYNKELLYISGVIAHQLNKNDESIKYIERAIKLDPDYKEAILFMVEVFKSSDEFEDIIELIERIKNLGASDPLYDWELARAYRELGNASSDEKALRHYTEAYNMLKVDLEFLKEFGYFLTETGKVTKAISIFESYLELEPSDTEVEEFVVRLKQF